MSEVSDHCRTTVGPLSDHCRTVGLSDCRTAVGPVGSFSDGDMLPHCRTLSDCCRLLSDTEQHGPQHAMREPAESPRGREGWVVPPMDASASRAPRGPPTESEGGAAGDRPLFAAERGLGDRSPVIHQTKPRTNDKQALKQIGCTHTPCTWINSAGGRTPHEPCELI